jgi:hypothetical protein
MYLNAPGPIVGPYKPSDSGLLHTKVVFYSVDSGSTNSTIRVSIVCSKGTVPVGIVSQSSGL